MFFCLFSNASFATRIIRSCQLRKTKFDQEKGETGQSTNEHQLPI